MYRYRYVGDLPAHIPDAGVEVQPGDEFECALELNSASLVLVVPKSAPSKAPAEEAEA